MRLPNLNGFLDLVYHSPNNWENRIRRKVYIHLIWSENSYWRTRYITTMGKGDVYRIKTGDLDPDIMQNNLALAYPSLSMLPEKIQKLPIEKTWYSEVPAWRNSTGFTTQYAQVSYQAEIEPFPPKASLLTFHPFIQYSNMQNNLIIINATNDPMIKEHELKVYNSMTANLIDIVKIKSNSTSEIPLDQYDFNPSDLPVFACDTMAGIPFGLGISTDNLVLSLEHTHPPASLVIFGDRRLMQSNIKQIWFQKLGIVG